jgi:CO/xanthine dehydrogenase FAD-binding subunit
MQGYDYLIPTKLNEALELKGKLGRGARFVAGGTDVLVLKKQGRLDFEALISLRRIEELAGISQKKGRITLGAGTTLTDLLESEVVRQKLPILHDAVKVMGCTQMRNRATVGGNVMSAVSSGDTIPPLICLEAQCHVVSPSGERTLPMDEMFVKPRTTALAADEILKEIVIPTGSSKKEISCGAFLKLGRRAALDLAVVSLAVQLKLDSGHKKITAARAAAGAVGPTPIRLRNTEKVLAGANINDDFYTEAATEALGETQPWDDVRASKWYRQEMIKVLVPRTIKAALSRGGAEV